MNSEADTQNFRTAKRPGAFSVGTELCYSFKSGSPLFGHIAIIFQKVVVLLEVQVGKQRWNIFIEAR